mgnify:CR=1 FL=1
MIFYKFERRFGRASRPYPLSPTPSPVYVSRLDTFLPQNCNSHVPFNIVLVLVLVLVLLLLLLLLVVVVVVAATLFVAS